MKGIKRINFQKNADFFFLKVKIYDLYEIKRGVFFLTIFLMDIIKTQ